MPNQLIQTADGSHSILSEQFGVSYHSKHGAIQETQHLNAYMTLIEATHRNLSVDYTGYEAFPISREEAKALNYPALLQLSDTNYPFQLLHDCDWEQRISINSHFSFLKCLQTFDQIIDQNRFDIVYFDAFAPTAQPDLWKQPLLEKMYQALKPDGVFVTYCAKKNLLLSKYSFPET